MILKVVILVIYLLGLAYIGVLASRQVDDIGDYFVGGKKLGYWLVSFSSRARFANLRLAGLLTREIERRIDIGALTYGFRINLRQI